MVEGEIKSWRRQDGTVEIAVRPGPLRVSFGVLASRDPKWVEIRDGLLIFRGVQDDGKPQVAAYRPVGIESDREHDEGGWLVCDPVT